MTAPGTALIPMTYRCSCCGFPCITTSIRRCISTAGLSAHRRAGICIGARAGPSTAEAGITGIIVPWCAPRHRNTSATIPATVIRVANTTTKCVNSITAINRGKRRCAGSHRSARQRMHRFSSSRLRRRVAKRRIRNIRSMSVMKCAVMNRVEMICATMRCAVTRQARRSCRQHRANSLCRSRSGLWSGRKTGARPLPP